MSCRTARTHRPAAARPCCLSRTRTRVRLLASRVLTDYGYAVLEARNGREALTMLAEPSHGVQLVLTDLVMPDMGGLELSRQIGIAHPEVRVVYMSGYAEGDKVEPDVRTLAVSLPGKAVLRRESRAPDPRDAGPGPPLVASPLDRHVRRLRWRQVGVRHQELDRRLADGLEQVGDASRLGGGAPDVLARRVARPREPEGHVGCPPGRRRTSSGRPRRGTRH